MSYGIPTDRRLNLSDNEICEDCTEETPATWKVAGETDSFGTEWICLCDEHHTQFKEGVEEHGYGPCDICGSEEDTYRTRDPEEGSHGPVYVRCQNHRMERLEDIVYFNNICRIGDHDFEDDDDIYDVCDDGEEFN